MKKLTSVLFGAFRRRHRNNTMGHCCLRFVVMLLAIDFGAVMRTCLMLFIVAPGLTQPVAAQEPVGTVAHDYCQMYAWEEAWSAVCTLSQGTDPTAPTWPMASNRRGMDRELRSLTTASLRSLC
jgi:hypothetical protein